jgi:hypothetical protein
LGYAPRSNEATPPNLAIRYHFPLEVALDPREPVIIETLIPNSTDFKQWGIAPDDIRDMASIHAHLLEVARKHGGEAWRATTRRGEMLCAFVHKDGAWRPLAHHAD